MSIQFYPILVVGTTNMRPIGKKVQSYSDETGSIWEDVKFGFIYGSQLFIDRIKDKYLSDKPDDNFP